MTRRANPCSDFLRSEAGAVTVDWVVLTAALVGLGLAVLSMISVGVEDISGDIDDEMRGNLIRTSFAERLGAILNTGFDDGAAGWTGGTVASLAGFGEVLQIAGGETAEIALDVPDGASTATVSFDLIGADDLDGDAATIFVNGQQVSVYRDDHGNVTVAGSDVSGVTVSVAQQYYNEPEGAGSHGHDSRATYTITVEDPGESLSLGISSGADDGLADEFYAIDDVAVSAS